IAGRAATLKTSEIEEIVSTIQGTASPEVNFKMGNVYNEALGDAIRVTVIATGFPSKRSRGTFRAVGSQLGRPGRISTAESVEPSDAQSLKNSNETDRWTKPAYLRMKAAPESIPTEQVEAMLKQVAPPRAQKIFEERGECDFSF
ncbi:hypothetical protein OY671_010023, partial [Metschnikowia pulcherrima]